MSPKCLIALIILTRCLFATAQTPNITVVTEEYPPYNFQGADKKISGFSTQVVEETLKRAKLSYQLDIYPWARAYHMAQAGPNVLIYSIGRSAEREELFKWVGVIAPYDVYLYRLKTRSDIKGSSLEALKKYTIGAVREDVRAQYLAKAGMTLDLVTSDSLNARKLAQQRVDLLPIDEMGVMGLFRREGMDPDSLVKVIKLEDLSSGLYMAFSLPTSDEVVNRCREALAELKADGTLERIRAKYIK